MDLAWFNSAPAPLVSPFSFKETGAKAERQFVSEALFYGWNTIHGELWRRKAVLGKGGYGSVFIGQRTSDGMVFAVKSANLVKEAGVEKRGKNDPHDVLCNEMMFMNAFRCKYIVRMIGCGRSYGTNSHQPQNRHSSTLGSLDMFLEYIPRGSLYHLMRRLGTEPNISLPENFIRAYTTDILNAVEYLHNKQCVHGDIKPLNLLVANDCLKLADFGGCKSLKQRKPRYFQIATLTYIAPEVYNRVEQGMASDVFSVGCTVLEMVLGKVPEPLCIPPFLSQEGQSFLRRCITSDPHKRWTASQLLQHPFICNRDLYDDAPYSTTIPIAAETMILQPPPIDYSDNLISPTYIGARSPAYEKKVFKQPKINDLPHFREENITLSPSLSLRQNPSQPNVSDTGTSDTSIASSDLSLHVYPNRNFDLPNYKPEFEPPKENNFNSLVLNAPTTMVDNDDPTIQKGLNKGKIKLNEDEARKLERTVHYMGLKELEQLKAQLPILDEYNANIMNEATKAEEAGVYENKLCSKGQNNIKSSQQTQRVKIRLSPCCPCSNKTDAI